MQKSYLVPKIEWSFNINLSSSDKIKEWKCPSHKLKIVKEEGNYIQFELDEDKIPQKDLCFSFERVNPDEALCTVAD